MNVILTGAKGQLGMDIMSCYRNSSIHKHLLIPVHREQVDITNTNEIEAAMCRLQPKLVINCAAYTDVEGAEHSPERSNQVNHIGAENLAKACDRHGSALMHVSTDYVFDGSSPTPYTEDDLTNPINTYGTDKWKGEQAIRSILKKHIIVRTGWLFSAHSHNFVRSILRKIHGSPTRNISVVADQFGTPTPTTLLSQAILSICEHLSLKHGPWGTFHIAGFPSCSWYEFATRILSHQQKLHPSLTNISIRPITSQEFSTVAQRPSNSALNSHKARHSFGLPYLHWDQELNRVLETTRINV